MVATFLRRRLDATADPTEMLRTFRCMDGLFGMIGAWHDSRAVIGFAPVRRLPPEEDPFAAVSSKAALRGRPGFGGGWVGAFGYQLGSRVETLPPPPPRPLPREDFSLAYYDHVLVRDGGEWWFEALLDEHNRARIDAQHALVVRRVRQAVREPRPYTCSEFVATPDAGGHRAAVDTTLRHLAAGDIFQANVCRRFEADFVGDPLDVFCAGVERLAPSYAAFIRLPEGAIASLSPELFLHRTDRLVRTAPIKGTAPLSVDVADLVASAKDRAENVMIVDLMRNDLGRVCVPGSVQVEAIARAERHTGVWHLVSDVVGTLSPGQDDAGLLRATFPPGSVTGAPKVRAMEVIHEVEKTGRETYTGAIGYVSPAAGLELNVAIRTFEFSGGRVWFGVGGGVVVDSTPEGELAETLVKASPLVAVIRNRRTPQEADGVPLGGDGSRDGTMSSAVSPPGPEIDPARGVFTTCLVEDGTPLDLARHLARLSASVEECYRAALPADLALRIDDLASSLPPPGPHRLRVTVTPAADGSCQAELSTTPLAPGPRPPWFLVPVAVAGGLGLHKYGDRRRLAAVEPERATWSDTCDALVTDRDGSILETGRGNLFVVTDDAVHTPPLDGRLLPGVTRRRAIDELEAAGVAVVQRRLTAADLETATEVFVTNALDKARPVCSVDGVGGWDAGPTTRWLASRLGSRRDSRPPPAPVGRPGTDVCLQLIDNYDSFVYNLDQYLRELGARTHVVRNDAIDVAEIADAVESGRLQGIVISPGPGGPADAGVSTEVVERLGPHIPVLGVCLGHQCLAAAYGARVIPAARVMHGKASLVHHDGQGVFAGLDGPLVAGRYHSLVVSEKSLPPELVVTARTGTGVVMGVRHCRYDVEGVQFHPESILSRSGHQLLATFLATCRQRQRLRMLLST